MQIIAIDANAEHLRKLRCALDLRSKPYDLCEVGQVREIDPDIQLAAFRVALIGTDVLSDALSGIVFLRGRMPAGRIIAYGQFSALDSETPARLKGAGADAVLDSRFNPSKLALLIDRFNQNPPLAKSKGSPPQNWIIQGAMRVLAPAAHAGE